MTLDMELVKGAIYNSRDTGPQLLGDPRNPFATSNRPVINMLAALDLIVEQQITDRGYSDITFRNWHEETPTIAILKEAIRKAERNNRFGATPAATAPEPAEPTFRPGDRVILAGHTAWLDEDGLPGDLIGAYRDGNTVAGTIVTPVREVQGVRGWEVRTDDYGTWWFRQANLTPEMQAILFRVGARVRATADRLQLAQIFASDAAGMEGTIIQYLPTEITGGFPTPWQIRFDDIGEHETYMLRTIDLELVP